MSLPPTVAELARAVTRRDRSLLDADLTEAHDRVAERVRGRRVLVVGGAGSIGSATAAQLVRFAPSAMHVVDIDENGLTELVRDLRSQGVVPAVTDLRTTPLDAGSPAMRRLITASRYDLVLNFAAVKHVRSEKDALSLLRMLEVNIRMPRRLLENVADVADRYFAVSTDKAANPVNLMGATKRAMEHVLLDEPLGPAVTSARFANVAFSQGSLLDGWLRRLAKRQPWAVPEATRRYFVSPEEAGQLCLLASTLGPAGQLVIPTLEPADHLRDLVEVATDVMGALGLTPQLHRDEQAARRAAERPEPGTWPLLVTALDTAGEKEYEEFVADGDAVHDLGFRALKSVEPPRGDAATVHEVLAEVSELLDDSDVPVDEDAIEALVSRLVPELAHRRSDRTLDARM